MKNRPAKKDSDKDFIILALIMVSLIWWKYTLPIIATIVILGLVFYFTSNRFKNWVNTRILRRKPPTKPNGTTSAKPIPVKKEFIRTPPKVIIKEVVKVEKPDIKKITTSDLIEELTNRGKLY